jgi:hypothetical protein
LEYEFLNSIRGKIQQQQTSNDTKVSMYLEGINKYNDGHPNATHAVSDNGSRSGRGEAGSGSGSAGSNLAYLDSTAGHRNISGSNAAGSGSGNNSGSNGSNIQYVPILVMCCPNLLRNEPCFCGHQQSVQIPANNLAVSQFLSVLANPGVGTSTTGSGGTGGGSHTMLSKPTLN